MKKQLIAVALASSALSLPAMANDTEVSVSAGYNQVNITSVNLTGIAVGTKAIFGRYELDIDHTSANTVIFGTSIDNDFTHARVGYRYGGNSPLTLKPLLGATRIYVSGDATDTITTVDLGVGFEYAFRNGFTLEGNVVYLTPTDSELDSDTTYTIKGSQKFTRNWSASVSMTHYDTDYSGYTADIIYTF